MCNRSAIFATFGGALAVTLLLGGCGPRGEVDAEDVGRVVAFDLLLSIHQRDRAGFYALFDAEATTEAELDALLDYYVAIDTFRRDFAERFGDDAWPALSDVGPVSGDRLPTRLPDLYRAVSDAANMPIYSLADDVVAVELPPLHLDLRVERATHGGWVISSAKGPASAAILAHDAQAIHQHLRRMEAVAAHYPDLPMVRDPEVVLRELRVQLRSLPASRVRLL